MLTSVDNHNHTADDITQIDSKTTYNTENISVKSNNNLTHKTTWIFQ
jgi:hypothetical protein